MDSPVGIYIHIPFCQKKCPYCDFYSVVGSESDKNSYTEAIIRAILYYKDKIPTADTLYFGGGTPYLLGTDRLCTILSCAKEAFSLDLSSEITLEANPEFVKQAALNQLARAGVNRLSLGLQSVQPQELACLGRTHTPQQAAECVEMAQAAGIDNISLDLMIGISGQTIQSLCRSIDFCARLPISHISAYLLKVEEGTPYFQRKETLNLPSEDDTAALYEAACSYLGRAGFEQYEISNFARDGLASRHNLKYWRCQEYLGLGCAAHSFIDGKRSFFPRALAAFIADPFTMQQDGAGGDSDEYIMLGLRLCEGISFKAYEKRFDCSFPQAILDKAAFLENKGLLQIGDDKLSLTSQGFLLSNPVISYLL